MVQKRRSGVTLNWVMDVSRHPSAGAIGIMTGDVMVQAKNTCSNGGHVHPTQSAEDFLFVAGKHWKVLVLLMVTLGWLAWIVTCIPSSSHGLVLEGCQSTTDNVGSTKIFG